jgi:pilus assembly protein CpaE
VLCGLDVPTLKNVKLAQQTLDLLSFPLSRVRFVLNRSNSKVGMKRSEVETALGVKMAFEIPSDRAVPLSVNRGTPAVLADAGCDFSRAVRSMAKGLRQAEQAKTKKKLFALART